MQQAMVGLFLILISTPVLSEADPHSFFDRQDEGWFFYNEVFPDEKTEDVPENQPPSKPIEKIEPLAMLEPDAPPAPAVPAPLSAEWMRENLDKYKDIALDDPTEENVARYFQLQRVVMDKASRFSDMAKRVSMKNPMLDENTRRPLMTSAARGMDARAKVNTRVLLKEVAKTTGLFFFYSSDCPYCLQQVQVLKNIERIYGFTVLPISLDGQPLPDGSYPNYKTDQGQASMLNVSHTPSLFLFREPDQFAPVSQGIVSMEGFSERVVYMAQEAGWIDQEQFDSTLKYNNTLISSGAGNGITDELLADPALLSQYLQTQLNTQRTSK